MDLNPHGSILILVGQIRIKLGNNELHKKGKKYRNVLFEVLDVLL